MKNKLNNGCSLNEWAKVIAQNSFIKEDEVPEGWLTSGQIAEQCGIDITTAGRHARMMVKDGRAEMKEFRIRNQAGAVRKFIHYHLLHKSINPCNF